MTTKAQLSQLVEMVRALVGHEYLYFDVPATVKTTPHTHPFHAWGVCIGPKGNVWAMDGDEVWHNVEDVPADEQIIASLHQRVSVIHKNHVAL